MNQFWQMLDGPGTMDTLFAPENVLLSLLLAFVLGQVLAWIYYATHLGLSYSRNFVQSLILITVVVSMVMAVIGSSIITALGLMGALAIIRFRNIIKDTRDLAFIFFALVVGMACGSQRYAIAVVGAVILCLIVLYLHLTSFGSHQPQNGFLRFRYAGFSESGSTIHDILKRFCSNFTLISVQNTGPENKSEYSYQLVIKNPVRNEQLISDLENVQGIENTSLIMQEQLLDI